jgi:hypothetical protein
MSLTSETSGTPPIYRSFLLRLWRESEHSAWRASMESVMTGERHGFPNLASLLAFLQAECQESVTHGREDLVNIGIPVASSDVEPT